MQESSQEPEVIEEGVAQTDGQADFSEEQQEETPIGNSEEEAEIVEESPLTAEQEAERWRETALRTAADLENYRKRMARERSEDLRFARAGLVEELLPVFDNFSMGLQMAEKEQDSMIYKGMAMVKGQLDDFLEAQGLKEVSTTGVFDPNLHDAVAEEEKEGAEAGEILFVKRKGYTLHDRLIRAAGVIVAKAPEPQSEDSK
ncbi:MAG: nucleotide exchange factor GrpE [Akkermansiaceae bacterium]|jgi:molecular chaperone GrpE|nr:nucleotide exchange factor GrpE [Akkermansiaceae bacterium]